MLACFLVDLGISCWHANATWYAWQNKVSVQQASAVLGNQSFKHASKQFKSSCLHLNAKALNTSCVVNLLSLWHVEMLFD